MIFVVAASPDSRENRGILCGADVERVPRDGPECECYGRKLGGTSVKQ